MAYVEINQGEQTYRLGKLSAIQQFHLTRKIAPVVPAMVPVFLRLANSKTPLLDDPDSLTALLAPFADAMAKMPDEDANYLLGTCLSVVARKQGDAWKSVWDTTHGTILFDDIDLSQMMPIVIRVLRENLGNFISGLLTNPSIGQAEQA
ncbi:phage tail assembly chaperone [Uliginosibacterium sp. sgz301328]|uniref:phage tail assembly chaperone n=1 Tax=Uliginosibacterium sp. sgz301328 TaxID=3243764 RepID=UPI00359DF558